ncbi:MAG: ergothioneine biosynthesis protein EgtC [Alkalinema sp. CACIAM 70d]|nr:MAG: ergothioneine biosynthesis protein EgtC [Alkalinema sp. CACIAM 70d]
MCRILGYLGEPVQLDQLLLEPDHSLMVQSYQPKEMTAGLLNADGFGVGWYHATKRTEPYTYRSIQPIWSDLNLANLSRYVESGCILANVRSATPGLAVDLSNCQPFQSGNLLFVHNGYIEQFRQTLYRPIRDRLSDRAYQSIHGLTDSEHIFALFLDAFSVSTNLTDALTHTLKELVQLSQDYNTHFSANIIISDGQQMVASRYASRDLVPTLYWVQENEGILIASEPCHVGDWQSLDELSVLTINHDRSIATESLSNL